MIALDIEPSQARNRLGEGKTIDRMNVIETLLILPERDAFIGGNSSGQVPVVLSLNCFSVKLMTEYYGFVVRLTLGYSRIITKKGLYIWINRVQFSTALRSSIERI